MTGELFDGRKAAEMGLVNKAERVLTPSPEVFKEAIKAVIKIVKADHMNAIIVELRR